MNLCRWINREARRQRRDGNRGLGKKPAGRKARTACACLSDPCIDTAIHNAAQLESIGRNVCMARHIACKQNLAPREQKSLSDLASCMGFEAVTRADKI